MTNNEPGNINETTTTITTTKEKRLKREFILNKDVNPESVEDIIMAIDEINRTDNEKEEENPKYVREPIKIIVNTYGGSVYDGFALIAQIDTSVTPVHTYLIGKAMSMGFLIFASGHKRFMHKLGTLMYHEISTGVHDVITGIKQTIHQSDNLMDMYDDYLLSVSNIPEELIDETKDRKLDLYIGYKKALEYGLCDEIMESTRDKNR